MNVICGIAGEKLFKGAVCEIDLSTGRIMLANSKPKERTLRKEDLKGGIKVRCVKRCCDSYGDWCEVGEYELKNNYYGTFYVTTHNNQTVYVYSTQTNNLSNFELVKENEMINELKHGDIVVTQSPETLYDPSGGGAILKAETEGKVEVDFAGRLCVGRHIIFGDGGHGFRDITDMLQKVEDPNEKELRELQETIDDAQRRITAIREG